MKIGLLGLGTVGSGVVEIINVRKETIKKSTGTKIKEKNNSLRFINFKF